MFLSVLFTEIFKSFTDPAYWQGNLVFLIVFIGVIVSAGLPIYSLINPKSESFRLLILPIAGFVNLLLLLLFWQNLSYFTSWPNNFQIPIVLGSYVFEWILILILDSRFLIHRYSLALPPLHPWFKIVSLLYLSLFLLISTRHFDPENHTFFVPGYELNHDSISLASTVKMLKEGISVNNSNLASYLGSLTLNFNYPMGGTQLELFFVNLLNQDVFFIYSRVILAGFLLSLYPLTYLFLKLDNTGIKTYPFLFILTLIFVVINYLTLSFLDTSVLGSTISIPLIISTFVLIYLFFNHSLSSRTFVLCLSAISVVSVFLYIYIPIVICGLFILSLLIAGLKPPSRLISYLIIAGLLSFSNPHNLLVNLTYLPRQFTSSNSEANLFLGMRGNLGNYLTPFMALSSWFSNPIYIAQGMRTSNAWITAITLGLLLTLLGFYPRQGIFKHRLPLILGFTFPFAILLLFSFLTHSAYQNAKVMQFFSPLWPIILYLTLLPYLFIKLIPRLIIILIVSAGILSGLYALSYVGKPVLAADLELLKLAPQICQNPHQSIKVLARDEWAKYFLMNCQNLDLYFERNLDWDKIVAFNQANHLANLSQPCADHSLSLIVPPKIGANLVLIDRCLNYSPSGYEPLNLQAQLILYAPIATSSTKVSSEDFIKRW
jgi:hypothetical protein